MEERNEKTTIYTDDSKRLLHVVNVFYVVPYFIGNQVDYLKQIGYSVNIACSPSKHFEDYADEKGFMPFPVHIQRSFSIVDDLKTVIQLMRFIKKNRISVVIGHTPKGGIIAMLAARLAGVKKRIYFRHGIMFETAKGMKRRILVMIERLTGALATKVVCVSNSVLKVSNREKLSAPHKNLILGDGTCNGVDYHFFSRTSVDPDTLNGLYHEFNINRETFVIGFVGRLVKDKGIQELVRGFEILQQDIKDICLLLVGPLEERDAISPETVEKIKTNPGIICTGFKDNVRDFYALMSLLILPSYREGFPTVVLEALSMNLPVITSKATGCIDSIVENETGIFCELEEKDIANKIKYYYRHPAIAQQHATSGRERVIRFFSQKRIWEELEKKALND